MKIQLLAISLMLLAMLLATVTAAPTSCTRIQDGVLTYSAGHWLAGHPLMIGYDPYGYNYQSHMFNGYYCNSYLGKDGLPPYEGDAEAYLAENPEAENKWYWPYRDVWLMMQWNDAWLSNKDCDGDGALDRHYGFIDYDGSGAWLTNHQSGEDNGYNWNYYVMIITPSTADGDYSAGGYWYDAEGNEIGSQIWGAFARVLQVYNDQGTGDHGLEYLSEVAAGFGYYK